MKNFFAALCPALVLLSSSACVHTSSSSSEPAGPTAPPAHGDSAAGKDTTLPHPFLWTLERDGKKSYLFGTVHVGVNAEKDLPPSVWNAFKKTPCFVMEADQSEMEPRTLQAMATLPEGETLPASLSKEAWEKLRTRLAGALPPTMLEHAKPWFATIVFMQQSLPPGEPMDGAFQHEAKAANKRVEYLENWREAISAFARATDAHDLEDMVLHEPEAKKQTDALIAAYRSGDEARLGEVLESMNAETKDAAAKLKILITERNALWLPRLKASIRPGGCFVAVGAAHLIGKANLREQLTAEGYKIKRIVSVKAEDQP